MFYYLVYLDEDSDKTSQIKANAAVTMNVIRFARQFPLFQCVSNFLLIVCLKMYSIA